MHEEILHAGRKHYGEKKQKGIEYMKAGKNEEMVGLEYKGVGQGELGQRERQEKCREMVIDIKGK